MERFALPLAAFVALLFEIAATRVYAYAFPYHFAALAVSLAMLGLGLGAMLRSRFGGGAPGRTLARGFAGLAVSLPAFCAAALYGPNAATVLAFTLPPFLAAGLVAAECYARTPAQSRPAAYARDLGGAAAGCLAALPLLDACGALGLCLLLAGLCGAAAALAAPALARRRRAGPAAAALLAAFAAAAAARRDWPRPPALAPAAADKPLAYALRHAPGRISAHAWGAGGRADLYEEDGFPNVSWIYNDATNPSLLAAAPRTAAQERFLENLFAYLPFDARRPRRALVVGSGAGLEVTLAKLAGARSVTAVEVNAALVGLVRGRREFAGPVYDQPGVELFVDEGRRFLTARPQTYDLIQMSLVFTATAQSAAYALVEGALYTVEADKLFLSRLAPDGLLSEIDDSPDRTLRQFVTALTAFDEEGVPFQSALKRVAVLSNSRLDGTAYRQLLLVSPNELSPKIAGAIAAAAAQGGFRLEWLSGRAARAPYDRLAALGLPAFVARFPENVAACGDDAPYFFNMTKGARGTWRLARPFLGAAAAALFAAALWIGFSPRRRKTAAPAAVAALLGLAFMLAEGGLIQKLSLAAGSPAHLLSRLLFSLLLGCAAGGALSARLARRRGLPLPAAALAAALALGLAALWLQRLSPAYFADSGALRFGALFLTLAPVGAALGLPFPALLRAPALSEEDVAALWGVNGLASVAGACLGMIGALLFGITATLAAGTACYLLAAAAADRLIPG